MNLIPKGIKNLFITPQDMSMQSTTPSTMERPAPKSFLSSFLPTPKKTYSIADRGLSIDDTDLEEARKILFSEISNRAPERQMFESKIILNTALNRMKQYAERGTPKTLSEVLKEPNQYQGYNSKQYQLAAAGTLDTLAQKKMATVEGVLADIRANGLKDDINGSVFYIHKPDGSIWLKSGPLFAKSK